MMRGHRHASPSGFAGEAGAESCRGCCGDPGRWRSRGFGASGVAGVVDSGVEVLLGALVADQPGGPAGEAGDGIRVQ